MEEATSKTPQANTQEVDYNDLDKIVNSVSISNGLTGQDITQEEFDAKYGALINDPTGYQNALQDINDSIAHEQGLRNPADNPVIGMDFDYNYVGARPLLSDDLPELQAQRQSQWAKRGAMVGRILGETAINILEIPGVIGGAIAAGATMDVDKMTDNFWVNFTESMKEGLHDALPVYQRRAVREGNVFQKMLSADWWAEDGASGIAFMAAALVPGLGLAKLPKAMSITSRLARGGKHANKVLGMLDDVAVKTGLAKQQTLYAGRGVAGKQGLDIFNATVANTIYESGVEARGAQMAYKDSIQQMWESGEINDEQYQSMMSKSGNVAANVFGANAALLVGPNLIMSRMMLGPRALNTQKTLKDVKREAGRMAKKPPAEYNPYTGIGAKVIDPTKKFVQSTTGKGVLGSLKRGAQNTFREGLVEEAGQGAIEQYFGEGYIEKQLHGKRSKNIAQEWMDFVGTSDGQAAVLLGGLLSGPMSAYSHNREKKEHAKNVDNLITSINAGLDYRDALSGHKYKVDPNDPSKFLLDDQGNPIEDLEKQAEMATTIEAIEAANKEIDRLIAEGDELGAQALASQMQANTYYSFIKAGDEGIEIMGEMLKESPMTKSIVEEHNRQNGTKLTVDQYVEAEMQKATNLKEDHFNHVRSMENSLSNRDIRDLNIPQEEETEAEMWKEIFNNQERVKYVTQMHTKRHFEDVITNSEAQLSQAKKDGNKEGIRKAKKDIHRAKKNLEKVNKNVEELSTASQIDKRWKQYYKGRKKMAQINNGEVTDYLDGLMSDIRKAETEDELQEIIKKAQDEGHLLKGLKPQAIPEELKRMAESDNIIEALGAYFSLMASDSGALTEEVEQARNNVNRLYKGATDTFNKLLLAAENLQQMNEEHSARREELAKEYEELASTINALATQLNIEEGLDRRKIAKKAKENYRLAVKAKNEATTLLKKVEAEIRELDSKMLGNIKAINAYAQTMNAMANAMPSKEKRDKFKSFLNPELEEKTSFSSTDVFEVMPISMDDILEGLYREKQILAEMGEEMGEIVMEASEYEFLHSERAYYAAVKENLEKLIAGVDKTIKRNKRLAKTPENVELLLESNQIAEDLKEQLAEVDAKLFEIEDKLSNNIVGQAHQIMSFAEEVERIIQAIENLDGTGIAKPGDSNGNTFEFTEEDEVVNDEIDEDAELINPIEEDPDVWTQDEADQAGVGQLSEIQAAINAALGDGTVGGKKKQTPPPPKNTFKKVLDPTEGKGFDRIEDKDKGIFEAIFADTEERILNALSNLTYLYKKDPNKANPALRDIYLILQAHPHLADKVPQNIHEELVYAAESAAEILNQFTHGSKKALQVDEGDGGKKGKKDPKGEKGGKKQGGSTNPFVEFLVEETNIEEEIQKVIDEKKRSLRNLKMRKLKEKAEEAGIRWNLAIAQNDAITEGSEVFWSEEGQSRSGTVQVMLKTPESGVNVLIEDGDGNIKVVSIEQLSKKDRNATVLNKTTEEAYFEFAEERRKANEGTHTSMSVPLVHRGSEAFLHYMHEPRDKSNDIITPSVTISYAKHLASQGDANAAKAVAIFQKLSEGRQVTQEELEHFADYIPISLRVETPEGLGAGTNIPIKSEANTASSFHSMEGAVRREIIKKWLEAGGQFVKGKHPNTFKGVTMKWSHIGHGQLNVDANAPSKGFNKLTNLQGVTYDNMEIFAIQDDNGRMQAYNKHGHVVNVPFSTDDKTGMVVLQVPTNKGTPFPVILEQKQLKGSKELSLIMRILEDIMDGANMETPLSKAALAILKDEIPRLHKAFKGEVTNGAVINTVMYAGKPNTQTQMRISPKNKTITLGDITYTAEDFKGNKATIERILGFKYHRTGFSNPAKLNNMLTVENKAYLEYLIEDKILRTNLMENAPLFVAVPVEGTNQYTGMGAFLTPASVRVEPGTKIGTKPAGKKLNANRDLPRVLRVKLRSKGVKLNTLTDEKITQLAAIYESTKLRGAGKAQFDEIVKQINEEAGDNKPEKC